MSMRSAQYWIDALKLIPHPEGGFYRRTTRANYVVRNQNGNNRFAYTTIYFLLTPESPSHFHRLRSDEIWLYHAGDPLIVHSILNLPDDAAVLAIGGPDDDDINPEDIPVNTCFVPQCISEIREVRKQEMLALNQCYTKAEVGPEVDQGQQLQYTVPANAIFGSSVAPGGKAGYSLVSCIVSPGFNFKDFELFTQDDLMKICPQHESVIRQLAYEVLPRH